MARYILCRMDDKHFFFVLKQFNFNRYASELDVPINEVYSIVDHLVYWAKVKIIYPISENNIYVIHPLAQIHM
jgi:hypothetical protein